MDCVKQGNSKKGVRNVDPDRVNLWHQLLKCYKGMERDIGNTFHNNYRQSLSRFDVLDQLSRVPDDWISVGELTKRLLDTAGSISALLNRMEAENLINRRLNADDRRSFQVSLTETGKDLQVKMSKDYSVWVTSVMGEFSNDERKVLSGLLDRLTVPKRISDTGA